MFTFLSVNVIKGGDHGEEKVNSGNVIARCVLLKSRQKVFFYLVHVVVIVTNLHRIQKLAGDNTTLPNCSSTVLMFFMWSLCRHLSPDV